MPVSIDIADSFVSCVLGRV